MSSRAPLQVLRSDDPAEEHSYIVALRPEADKQAHLDHIATHIAPLPGHSDVTHADWTSDCFHGYAGKFSEESLDALLRHPDVEYVEENPARYETAIEVEKNAPWGLARINQTAKLTGTVESLTYSYTYDSTAGKGVDIYVVDAGIYCEHDDFGGRATWGTNVLGTLNKDNEKGHGTHCAGIAGGKQYGVAKAANLIAVKVLPYHGHGSAKHDISGLNWVKSKVAETGRPSVISMSVGGSPSKTENIVVGKLTAAGIHFVTSAGNGNVDAKERGPANAPTALTVGATTIEDARWIDPSDPHKGSNWGSCVDVFAPGAKIISCGINRTDAQATKTGTSQACPHVSGLIACFIAKNGNLKPDAMNQIIKDLSLKDILTGIPAGTANRLLHTDDHFISDGAYTISPVKKDEDLVRVPKPATDKKQENVQADRHKDEKHPALYVEPLDPKTKEIDPYEQWDIKRIYPSEEDLKTTKPHWTPYYTIQNVGSKEYAWADDQPSSGEPVVENMVARIWEIDVLALNPNTLKDECVIKFTTSMDKTYYWGLTDDKDQKSVDDRTVKIFDEYSPYYNWYITKVPEPVKKNEDKSQTKTY